MIKKKPIFCLSGSREEMSVNEIYTPELVAFCGHTTEKCPNTWWLSNWSEHGFIVQNGAKFRNNEQFMMYMKATLFGDFDTARQIGSLDTSLSISEFSKQAKALGRKVSGFDQGMWERHRKEFVTDGLQKKVEQNPELQTLLLNTGNAVIAEAAWYDEVWGTKLKPAETKKYFDAKLNWPGLNLLGRCWMIVREGLKSN